MTILTLMFYHNIKQLQNLGNSISAVKDLQNVISNISDISQITVTETSILKAATAGYSKEVILASVNQGKFTTEQIKTILSTKRLTDAEIQQAISTAAISTANTGAIISTTGLTTAVKGLTVAMKTNPLFWALGAAAAVYGVVKFVDLFTTSVKEAKEKLSDSVESFKSLKSELDDINSQLATTRDRMKELNDQPSLTYVEQSELDKLKEATKELELQANNKRIELKREAEDLSNNHRIAFDKEYGDDNFSMDDVNELVDSFSQTAALAEYGLEGLAAAYIKVQQEKKKAEESGDFYDISMYSEIEDELRAQLEDNLMILQEYRDNLNTLKDFRSLTEEEQARYDNIGQGIQLIYQMTDPSAWNQIEFDSIFDANGIEVTKEKLIELAQEGKLSEDTIKSYKNLYDEINQGKFILKDGETTLSSFIQQFEALANAQKKVADAPEILPIIKSDAISNINELSEGFESLDKIMASISDENPFDYTLLDSKSFKDTFGDLEDEYTNFIDTITKSPKDINACQSAFDDLITTWLNGTGVLCDVTEDTADLTTAMLANWGIVNAEEIVTEALTQNYANLTAQEILAANAGEIHAKTILDEYDALLDLADGSEETVGAIIRLEVAKLSANGVVIATEGDMGNIAALMEKCGHGVAAIRKYQEAKAGMAGSMPMPKITAGGITDPEQFQADLKAWASGAAELAADAAAAEAEIQSFINKPITNAQYNGGEKNKKSGSSGGGSNSSNAKEETKKEFDWMQRALDVLSKKRVDYQKVIDNETESYQDQFSALEQLIALDKQFIELNNQAIDTYTKRLETAKSDLLSVFGDEAGNAIIGKILNGDLSMEGSTDEYNQTEADYIQATIDALSDLESSKDKHREALETETEHTRKQYALRIQQVESYLDKVNAKMTKAESKLSIKDTTGKEITEADYKQLIALSKQQVSLYRDQIDALEEQLDTVEPMSAEFYSIQSSIASCQNAIASAAEAQAEWNEKIKRIPIDRIQRYLDLLGYIKQDIQNFIDEQSALGISATQAQYQQLIQISNEEITKLLEQQKKLSTLLKDYQYNSDKYNEVAGEIQDINNEISSLVQSQYEWNQAILQIPINALNKAKDTLQSIAGSMSDVLSDYDAIISAIVSTVDKEIESINDLRDSATDYYDSLIDPLQEQLDLLQATNKERSIQYALEKALFDVETARNQKKVAVVRNGEITYEADAEAVRNAQESLQDAEYNKLVHDLETQISNLEDARDTLLESYDDQMKALEKIKNKWSELVNEIKLAADQLKVTEMFGEGWQSSLLSGNDAEMYEAMKDMYSTMYNQQQSYQDQIDSYERIADMMSQFVEKFQDGSITYEEAMSGIGSLIDAMEHGFSSLDYLNGLTDLNGASDLASLLSSMESSANASFNQFQDYMKIVKANSDALSEYTTSWAELQQLVQQQINELKKLYEKSQNKSSSTDTYQTGALSSYAGNLNQDVGLEAVRRELDLTQPQISTLLDNITGIGNVNIPVYQPPTIDYSSILGTTKDSDAGITINTMNIELPDVKDPDGFAKAIDSQFRHLMHQEMTKKR